MAGVKITDLPLLLEAKNEDLLYIVDTTDNTSKQIEVGNLKGYKVYTALLTQSGGDELIFVSQNPPYNIPIVIGRTYIIYSTFDPPFPYDFTNIGAPSNEEGVTFVATGTTPNSWGSNGELRSYTGAPTAVVLENTIGGISFTYSESGKYIIQASPLLSLFTEGKTYITIGLYTTNLDGAGTFRNSVYFNDNSQLRIITQATNDGYNWIFTDSILNNTPIEIRVYN